MSLPSRERGLKYRQPLIVIAPCLSLPSRERGLKLLNALKTNLLFCRSLRGSVD